MIKSIIEMREEILSSIRQKTRMGDIHLTITRHGKARVLMHNGNKIKDFVNQTDALQWLIYTYNLKQFKNSFSSSYTLQAHSQATEKHESAKDSTIEQASQTLLEKIVNSEHYTSEIYRSLMDEFDQLKYNENFTSMEMNQIYSTLIKRVQRLIDDTFSHKRYQVYKKYLEQLKKKKNGY